MIRDDRLTPQVQSNDQLKSVFGPGLERNRKAKEEMTASYRQQRDDKGVITIFNFNSLNALESCCERRILSNDLEFMQFLILSLLRYYI